MTLRFFRLWAAGSAVLLASAPVLAENISPDLQFNGFATVGAAWTSGGHSGEYLNNGLGRTGISGSPSIDYDSVVGMQFTYKANDKVDLVTQLVAKGRTSEDGSVSPWAMTADWAYVAYHLTDEATVRAGRFNFNTYMYSDNQRVGQAWPWARLPAEVYSALPLENYDGVELLYKHAMGDWNLMVQPYAGSHHDNNFTVNRLTGVNANLSNDNLTLHAGTSQSELDYTLTGLLSLVPPSIDPLINVKKNRASYTDFGALYDDGEWFLAAEFAMLRNKGWPVDTDSGYVSAGHYFGDWLPYVLYGRIKTVNNDETLDAFPAPVGSMILPVISENQHSLAAGVRYQIRPNTCVKAQIDRISGFDHTDGLFGHFSDPTGPSQLDTAYLYSLSLNVAF